MLRFLPGIIALSTVIATGIVHGIQIERWGVSSDLALAAARLKQIPAEVGDWQSTEQEIPQRQLDMAGAVGYVGRSYVNRITGATVNIVILCGKHGPMSVHSPTVCFTGAGWQLSEDLKKRTISGSKDPSIGEFWQGDFVRESAGLTHRIRTLWSWGTTGTWQAADAPRRDFAGSGHLYKLYVTINSTETSDKPGADYTDDFLKVFLPVLKSSLQPVTPK